MGIASVGHMVINNFIYARLPYDPARDLIPVGIAWDLPNVVVVPAQHNPSRSLAVLADSAYRLGCRAMSLEGCLLDEEKALLRRHWFFARQGRPVYARWKQPEAAPRAAFRLMPFDEDE